MDDDEISTSLDVPCAAGSFLKSSSSDDYNSNPFAMAVGITSSWEMVKSNEKLLVNMVKKKSYQKVTSLQVTQKCVLRL